MAFRFGYFVLMCLCVFSCGGRETSRNNQQIQGVYLNSYSANVINPATGEVVGTRTVKDSLFILENDGKFEVSNRKWMFNDYDSSGWVTSMRGESESMPPYVAEYNDETNWLEPMDSVKNPPLFFEGNKIFRGRAKALEYVKVEEVLE